jgi:tetratricopeptide (TPR) repeat protein
MTSKNLRLYLALVPLFRLLPRREQLEAARRLERKCFVRHEVLDLRGSRACVLGIVIQGRVLAETHGEGEGARRQSLESGCHTDPALLFGPARTSRARFIASYEGAEMLFLWRASLRAISPWDLWLAAVQSLAFWGQRLREWFKSAISGIGRALLRSPNAVGAALGVVLLALLLFLTPTGRSLRADGLYLVATRPALASSPKQVDRLSRVLALAPDHPASRVALGNMALKSGQWEQARAHYQVVAGRAGAAANNLGILYLETRDPAAAAQAFETSSQLDPDVAAVYQNLGIARLRLGQRPEAARAFREGLRIDPRLAVARYHLGMEALAQGALVEAATEFDRVLEQDPLCVAAHLGLGLVHREIGDLDRAAAAFTRAAQLDPHGVPARYYLGWTLARAGQRNRALGVFADLVRRAPAPELLDWTSAILAEERPEL